MLSGLVSGPGQSEPGTSSPLPVTRRPGKRETGHEPHSALILIWNKLRMRLLVVRAEQWVAQPLRQAGHDVAVASSCEEALAMAHTDLYDAIVLGSARSESAGLTACSELRRSCARTPILLIVARDGPENRIDGLDAGADDCISEPCAFPELLARLRALVRRAAVADQISGHVHVKA